MSETSVFLSVVIPVFNEEANIPIIHGKLSSILVGEKNICEIIFVNDGSYDRSSEIIAGIIASDKRVKALHFTRNFGHQAALTAGMDAAKGEILITLDCDLQDPPDLIPEMIKKWQQGAMVVFARRQRRDDIFLKKITAKFFYWLMRKFSDVKISGDIGDFRLVDRKVLVKLNNMREKSRYLRGMVAWLGFNYAIIDYDRPQRFHGKTGFSFLKMARFAMDGLLNFSLFPLRMGLVIGALCILMGFSFLSYIIFDAVVNHVEYPLYKWLIVALFMLIGFLFILLWIIAEYIGKIYEEARGRPLYVVQRSDNL